MHTISNPDVLHALKKNMLNEWVPGPPACMFTSMCVSTIRLGIDSEGGYVFVNVEDPVEVVIIPPPSGDDDDREKSTSLKRSLRFCTEYKLCGGYCSCGIYVPGLDDGSNRETRMLEFLSDFGSKLLELKLLE